MNLNQNKSSGCSNLFSLPGDPWSSFKAWIGDLTEFFPELGLLFKSMAVLPPHLADYLPDIY
jgi:hypothetical protein